MVEVVEALTDCHEGDDSVLDGADETIIRLISEHVSHAVDTPGDVQAYHVPEDPAHKVRTPGTLVPEVPGNDGGKNEGTSHCNGEVVSARNQKSKTLTYN